MRVLPASTCMKHFSKMWFATVVSTADSGESSKYTSALAYAARAMLTRCLWPPGKLIPYSIIPCVLRVYR
jgi:hypothetical protein